MINQGGNKCHDPDFPGGCKHNLCLRGLWGLTFCLCVVLLRDRYWWCLIKSCDDSLAQIQCITNTPDPPTKSFDFRGFDPSKLLIIRGGNSHILRI